MPSEYLGCLTIVEIEYSAQSGSPVYGARSVARIVSGTVNQLIVESLVVSLLVIMRQVFTHRTAQRNLAEE